MDKYKFLRIYVNFSIIIGLLLLISTMIYTSQFILSFYGLVSKTLFQVTIDGFIDITIFNTPLIIFAMLLVVNIIVMVRLGSVEEVEHKVLREVVAYNTLLTIMLVIGQVVFFLLIPERITGEIVNLFYAIKVPVKMDQFVYVINVNYILTITYVVYNIVVSMMSLPPMRCKPGAPGWPNSGQEGSIA